MVALGRERTGGLGGTAGSLGATRGPQGVKCPTNASPGHRRDALPVAARTTICLITVVPSHTVGGVVDPELRTQLEAMIHGRAQELNPRSPGGAVGHP